MSDDTIPDPLDVANALGYREGHRTGRNQGIADVIDRLHDMGRWIDSLHEDANGLVVVTKAELHAHLVIEPRRSASPETTPAGGTTTNCPLEGVHEHAFRGPHRFREWEPGT